MFARGAFELDIVHKKWHHDEGSIEEAEDILIIVAIVR